LAGKPNAGKSTLFNALAGQDAALVSAAPGTTRDYLVHPLAFADVTVELIDTAGRQPAHGSIENQAQVLGQGQAEQADLVLHCIDAQCPPDASEAEALSASSESVIGVATKCDLAPPPVGLLPTSAPTGLGVKALRELLAERARAHVHPGLAPSLSRCRHHVDASLVHLRQAHAAVLYQDPAEVLALELRGAIDQLGEMVGAIYTDDLLDRIFSRFCIGK
jgi:tRNA modification GTPase